MKLRVTDEHELEYVIGKKLAQVHGVDFFLVKNSQGQKRILGQSRGELLGLRHIDNNYAVLKALEQEDSDIKSFLDDGKEYHYDWLFPRVETMFAAKTSAVSNFPIKVLVLEYLDTDPAEFIFLADLLKSGRKIDERTSAWIMGRLLKLMQFLEISDSMTLRFSSDNLLIQPDEHRLTFLDFAEAVELCSDEKMKRTSLSDSAKFILDITQAETAEYIAFLEKLIGEDKLSAEKVHADFYALVHEKFGRSFHPFTMI